MLRAVTPKITASKKKPTQQIGRRTNVIFAAAYIPLCHGDMKPYLYGKAVIYFKCPHCEATDKAPRVLYVVAVRKPSII